jgi:hypothetical protein
MSREIHYCKCGQSIFGDMTDCGDCDQSTGFVIGVDPGPEQSAFVILNSGRVMERGIVANDVLARCDGYWSSRHVFIEMIACYGMAVGASVFETCIWIGRFTELSRLAGGKLSRVFRRDIKLHLCNSARAKDANVRQALIDRLGPQGTKKAPGPTYGVKSHEWAALAVAVYGWDQIFGRQTTNGVPPA